MSKTLYRSENPLSPELLCSPDSSSTIIITKEGFQVNVPSNLLRFHSPNLMTQLLDLPPSVSTSIILPDSDIHAVTALINLLKTGRTNQGYSSMFSITDLAKAFNINLSMSMSEETNNNAEVEKVKVKKKQKIRKPFRFSVIQDLTNSDDDPEYAESKELKRQRSMRENLKRELPEIWISDDEENDESKGKATKISKLSQELDKVIEEEMPDPSSTNPVKIVKKLASGQAKPPDQQQQQHTFVTPQPVHKVYKVKKAKFVENQLKKDDDRRKDEKNEETRKTLPYNAAESQENKRSSVAVADISQDKRKESTLSSSTSATQNLDSSIKKGPSTSSTTIPTSASKDVSITLPGTPQSTPSTSSSTSTVDSTRSKKTVEAIALLRNKNLVNLDDLNRVTRPRTTPLDESFDLKIRWRHEIFKIKVKPEDLMTKVLDHVAKKSGSSVNDINVYIDENSFTPLAPTASVKSLRINVASVLNARAKVEKKNITSKTVGDGSFEIKLQTKNKKQKPVMIR